VINFLLANIDSVIFIIAVVIIALVLIKRGYGKYICSILFKLVTDAEGQYGSGTGVLKKAAVITWLYERLPAIVKLLFTKKQISDLIEEAVASMQKYLEENKDAELKVMGSITYIPEA